jgi:RHS repeat-associated protein
MYFDNTSVEKYCGAEFGPFGEPLYERGVVSNYIPFRLYGMYKDIETGLYYNVRRYYDWRVGRYLQPDPVSDLNLYVYVNNSPYDLVDPLGMFETQVEARVTFWFWDFGDPRHEEITEEAAAAILPSHKYNIYGKRVDNWGEGPIHCGNYWTVYDPFALFWTKEQICARCRNFADTIAQGTNRADCLFADDSSFHCDNDNFEGCYQKGKLLLDPELGRAIVCTFQQSKACCSTPPPPPPGGGPPPGDGWRGDGGGSAGGIIGCRGEGSSRGSWTNSGGWSCEWTKCDGRLCYMCYMSGRGEGGLKGCSVVNKRLREKSSCPPYPWMCDPNNPGYLKDPIDRKMWCECTIIKTCSFAGGWNWERIGHFIHPVQDFWSHSNALFVSGCAVFSNTLGDKECVEPRVGTPKWTNTNLPTSIDAQKNLLFTGLYGGSKAGYSWRADLDITCSMPRAIGVGWLKVYPPCDLNKGVMPHCMLNKDNKGWDRDCYAPCYQGHWPGDCGGKDNMQRYLYSEARERALISSKHYLDKFCKNSPRLCY